MFQRLKKNQSGQAMVEYVVIIALISIVAIFSLGNVGNSIKDKFEDVVVKTTDPEDGYTDEEIDELIKQGYLVVANPNDLQAVGSGEVRQWATGTKWQYDAKPGENHMGAKFIQVQDIDMSNFDDFKPIGNYNPLTGYSFNSRFKGIYNGGGFTTSNLTIDRGNSNYIGLFGVIEGATIQNVILERVNISGKATVGGLVGRAQLNSVINNISVSGTVKGNDRWVGGLVGYNETSTIDNTHSSAVIDGSSWAGGLVGQSIAKSTIINSYATGRVSGTNTVGGLVGWDGASIIRNSYATGKVNGETHVGGLIGTTSYFPVNDEDIKSTIENNYATGDVTASGYTAGGLIGWNNGSIIIRNRATGNVASDGVGPHSTDGTGGLVGANENYGEIHQSYATGNVRGPLSYNGNYEGAGGLVGENQIYSTISDSYATGNVQSGVWAGGLVGINSGSIINSYTISQTSGVMESGGLVASGYVDRTTGSYYNTQTTTLSTSEGGTGKTTAEMKQQSTYENWDFDTIWQMKNGNYPTLKWQN